ncbi:hypothetical protein PG985_015932 [Apiospora marii]
MNLECFDPAMNALLKKGDPKRSTGIFLTWHQGVYVRSWPQCIFRDKQVLRGLLDQMATTGEAEQPTIHASKTLTEEQSERLEQDLHGQVIVKLDIPVQHARYMTIKQVAPQSTWHPHQKSFHIQAENAAGAFCFWLLYVDSHPHFPNSEATQYVVVCLLESGQETLKQTVSSYISEADKWMPMFCQKHPTFEKTTTPRGALGVQVVDDAIPLAGLVNGTCEPILEDDGIFHIKIGVNKLVLGYSIVAQSNQSRWQMCPQRSEILTARDLDVEPAVVGQVLQDEFADGGCTWNGDGDGNQGDAQPVAFRVEGETETGRAPERLMIQPGPEKEQETQEDGQPWSVATRQDLILHFEGVAWLWPGSGSECNSGCVAFSESALALLDMLASQCLWEGQCEQS